MSEQIAQKLEEAMALIEKGWTRGQNHCDGRYCLIGAVKMAFSGDPHSTFNESTSEVGAKVADLLVQAIGKSPWSWNDEQKSKKPVVAALLRAAELARQEAGK